MRSKGCVAETAAQPATLPNKYWPPSVDSHGLDTVADGDAEVEVAVVMMAERMDQFDQIWLVMIFRCWVFDVSIRFRSSVWVRLPHNIIMQP
jgi:hypothetical protein